MDGLIKTDCAVIGGGFAGCSAALELANSGKKVDLFVKAKLLKDSNSYLTAGGLAAVPLKDGKILEGDSYEKHVQETIAAGKYLNNPATVKFCVESFFNEVIGWLVKQGVEFDKSPSNPKGPEFYEYDLHKEGGHTTRRVFHASDKTGEMIMSSLTNLVKNHPNIKVHENHMAIDLVTRNKLKKTKKEKDICLGLYVYDINQNIVKTVSSKATFIATGGLGKVFTYTSNSDISTGDGFAMCYRMGLPLANMEFVQFHPTVFFDPSASQESERRFLLTEALRGEGAILKTAKDSIDDFVLKYDPRGSKATRDIVTRAEDLEIRRLGLKNLWLDCTKIPKQKLITGFKNAYEFCLNKGIDISKEPVPVIYAVHYSNGGVLVDKNSETKINNCYVMGEASYTGFHGATRLASNSAPECILFGRTAAKHFTSKRDQEKTRMQIPLWKTGKAKEARDKTTQEYYWETVRRTMTSLCGISRNQERLETAKQVLSALKGNINQFYWDYLINKDFLEIRNIADVANIILESALERKESRACHFREDFPKTDDKKYHGLTIIQKDKKPYILKLK